MNTKPSRSPITTHVAAFLLGVIAGVAAHPCTTLTSNPPATPEPDEPAAADSTG